MHMRLGILKSYLLTFVSIGRRKLGCKGRLFRFLLFAIDRAAFRPHALARVAASGRLAPVPLTAEVIGFDEEMILATVIAALLLHPPHAGWRRAAGACRFGCSLA
jgi:hypothetical protein